MECLGHFDDQAAGPQSRTVRVSFRISNRVQEVVWRINGQIAVSAERTCQSQWQTQKWARSPASRQE